MDLILEHAVVWCLNLQCRLYIKQLKQEGKYFLSRTKNQ